MKSLHFTILAALVLLSGCAENPYTQYYLDTRYSLPASTLSQLRKPQVPPQVIRVPMFDKQMLLSLQAKGYVQLGCSDFTGPGSVSEHEIQEQAEKVGADIVFISDIFHHSEQGVRGVPVYHPGVNLTANTSGNASVFGNYGGGYGSGFGNYGQTTTVTSPGTFTTAFVPVTINHIHHSAFYYGIKKPECMTPAERKANGL